MMQKIVIAGIICYQKVLSPIIVQIVGSQSGCRYPVTCSEYAKLSIRQHGIIRGGLLSVKRILSCQPYINSKVKI